MSAHGLFLKKKTNTKDHQNHKWQRIYLFFTGQFETPRGKSLCVRDVEDYLEFDIWVKFPQIYPQKSTGATSVTGHPFQCQIPESQQWLQPRSRTARTAPNLRSCEAGKKGLANVSGWTNNFQGVLICGHMLCRCTQGIFMCMMQVLWWTSTSSSKSDSAEWGLGVWLQVCIDFCIHTVLCFVMFFDVQHCATDFMRYFGQVLHPELWHRGYIGESLFGEAWV